MVAISDYLNTNCTYWFCVVASRFTLSSVLPEVKSDISGVFNADDLNHCNNQWEYSFDFWGRLLKLQHTDFGL